MSKKPFWMVYGEGQRAPTYKHDTPGSAAAEARRLAALNPGIDFWVLVTVGLARKVDVDFIDIDPSDDGIPF